MEFNREGKHTIKCVISEEEIWELGYTIDDIISNSARTQEFMNCIFDMAEQELDIKFEQGVKAVRADILPNHTISLTFSETPGTAGMMDHIKDIVNGLLSSIPKDKLEELKSISGPAPSKDIDLPVPDIDLDKEVRIIVLFAFEELDALMRYAKQIKVEDIPFNQLYKFEDAYFLMMDMSSSKEEDVKRLSALTDEYAAEIFVGAEKRAFIYEHGTAILKERAIEQLRVI